MYPFIIICFVLSSCLLVNSFFLPPHLTCTRYSCRLFENQKSEPEKVAEGEGEWKDWDSDAWYMDDISEGDDEDISFMPSMSILSALSEAGQTIGPPTTMSSNLKAPSKAKGEAKKVIEKNVKSKKVIEYDEEGYEIEETWRLGGGDGAWSDQNESDFFLNEDSASSTQLSDNDKTTHGRYDSWEGFSEEPPYFDENEILDDDDYDGVLSTTTSIATATAKETSTATIVATTSTSTFSSTMSNTVTEETKDIVTMLNDISNQLAKANGRIENLESSLRLSNLLIGALVAALALH